MNRDQSLDKLIQKRRLLSFQRQRKNREELIKLSRISFCTVQYIEEEDTQVSDHESIINFQPDHTQVSNQLKFNKITTNKKKYSYPYKKLSKMLQIQDFLISIPIDFNDFLVFQKPKGKKVLLLFRKDKVVVISNSGVIMTFTSNYLNYQQKTILQGIISDDSHTKIFITDVIQWRGQMKVGDEAVLRYFWLNSNLPKVYSQNQQNDFQFCLLPIYELTKEIFSNLCQNSALQFCKSGIVFTHRRSLYISGQNPGVLFWKYKNIFQENSLPKNIFTGVASIQDGNLVSSDKQVLMKLRQQLRFEVKEFKQVRFEYSGINLSKNNNTSLQQVCINLQGFQIVEVYHKSKYVNDSLNKLVYQYNESNNPITAELIYKSLT